MSLVSNLAPIELKTETVENLKEEALKIESSIHEFSQQISNSEPNIETDAESNDSKDFIENKQESLKTISEPLFHDPMTQSEIKNVSHNNASEISLLIDALEAQQKRTVTRKGGDNALYTQKLNEIFDKKTVKSDVIPERNDINFSSAFSNLMESNNTVVENRVSLVKEVESYLFNLRKATDQYRNAQDNLIKSSSGLSSIESISDIVANFYSGKEPENEPSQDVLNAISKLPSFDENGNIVKNKTSQPNDLTSSADGNTEVNISADELLHNAQNEALAQLEQDKVLDEKLKSEAESLNKKAVLDKTVKEIDFDKKETDSVISADIESLQSDILDKKIAEQISFDNNHGKKGIKLFYQKGYFDDNIESIEYVLSDDIIDIKEALKESSEVSHLSSHIQDNNSFDINLSEQLRHAVEMSLAGQFGNNVNEATCKNTVTKDNNGNRQPLDLSATNPVLSASEEDEDSDEDENIFEHDDEHVSDDEFMEPEVVTGREFNIGNVETDAQNNNQNLIDGNPKILRESTRKLIEEEQQFENKRLGRKLEPKDFYFKVEKTDPWFQDIIKSGYTDGPVFSALCYSSRKIKSDDVYNWTLEISKDFELLINSPEFHHNLQTKFSFLKRHPIELNLVKINGIPKGCPEDLARSWYLKEIEDARKNMLDNPNLVTLIEHLGDNIHSINLGIYTQNNDK